MLLLLFVTLASMVPFVLAQVTTRQGPNSAGASDGPALLREAHGLVPQLPVADSAPALSRVAHSAALLKMPEAEEWIRELLALAPKLQPQERELVQLSAASAMAKLDSAAALDMLEAVQPALPPEFVGVGVISVGVIGSGFDQPRTDVATAVFASYFDQHRVAGLARLQAAGERLAKTGQYPFSAWIDVVLKLQAAEPAQVPAVAKYLLGVAEQVPFGQGADEELMQFVTQAGRALPDSAKRSGVEIAVRHMLNDPDRKPLGHWQVSAGGVSAEFTNEADARLYRYLPTIRAMAPELAQELLKSRPELRAAPAQKEFGATGSGVVMFGGGYSPAAGSAQLHTMPEWFRRERNRELDVSKVMQQAMSDPQGAIRSADALTDDGARALAYAQLAEHVGANDPASGAGLLKKAQALLTKLDEGMQLDCMVEIANASLLMKDDAGYEDALKRALRLAGGKAGNKKPEAVSRLSSMVVRNGMRVLPEQTLAAIRGMENVKLRAELLADAAVTKAQGHPRRLYRVGDIVMTMEYDSTMRQ